MTNERRDMDGPLDLPMQPTGSGVADLEIAREMDALAADPADVALDGEAVAVVPTQSGAAAEESSAHPS